MSQISRIYSLSAEHRGSKGRHWTISKGSTGSTHQLQSTEGKVPSAHNTPRISRTTHQLQSTDAEGPSAHNIPRISKINSLTAEHGSGGRQCTTSQISKIHSHPAENEIMTPSVHVILGISMIHSRPEKHESRGAVIARNARDQQDYSPTAEHRSRGAINAQHVMVQQDPLTSCRTRK